MARSFWSKLWPFRRKGDGALTTSEAIWLAIYTGAQTKAGVTINYSTALQVMAVFACCRVIAEGISQLPLKLRQQRSDGGSDLATDHPLYELLHSRPNEWQSSFEFRETLSYHAVLTGNGFAFINRVGPERRIGELIPMIPQNVAVRLDGSGLDRSVHYEWTDPDGGQKLILPPDQVFHLRGPAWSWQLGLDVVRLAREAIGLALATEESIGGLHKNAIRAGGLLSTEIPLTDKQVANIKESWNKEYAGSQNAYKTVILEHGLKFSPMATTPEDAQTLANREFQIKEIARAFRVLPLMLMESDKTATYASVEQMLIVHVTYTLTPWVERWEQADVRHWGWSRAVASTAFSRQRGSSSKRYSRTGAYDLRADLSNFL